MTPLSSQISSPEDTRISDVYARGFVGLAAMNQLGNVPPAAAYDMVGHMAAHPEAASRVLPFVDIGAECTDVYDRAYLHEASKRALEAGYREKVGEDDDRAISFSRSTGMTTGEVVEALAADAPAELSARFYEKLYGGGMA